MTFILGCTDSMNPDRPRLGTPLFDGSGGGVVALDQRNSALGENGTTLSQGFVPQNPLVGDAIVVTLFWRGTTDIVDSVTDHLSVTGYPPIGNTYTRVEYVTSGGISMATYVATNVQNFPDAYDNPNGDSLLGQPRGRGHEERC